MYKYVPTKRYKNNELNTSSKQSIIRGHNSPLHKNTPRCQICPPCYREVYFLMLKLVEDPTFGLPCKWISYNCNTLMLKYYTLLQT